VTETPLQRPSLRQLLGVALSEFPHPDHQRRIRSYVQELSYLMDMKTDDDADPGAARARATCDATGEDVVTLLCKLEDYLESIIVGQLPRGVGG
jgi:hypothetical protein